MAYDRQAGRPTADPQDIREWLVARVAEVSGMAPAEIDAATPFDVYGVNSTDAVSISGELADRFGARLAPTALYDHPTIDALIDALAPEAPPAAPAGLASSGAGEHDPVCVVGMACRFPGEANTPEAYWNNLAAGFDASADVPGERWDAHARYGADPDAPGATYTTKGAFVGDLAGFDASFFGISPREALRMDPQQRMLLEVAWNALEDAGTAPDRLRGSNTGVFVGMMPGSQYASLQQDRSGPSVLDDPYLGLGTSSSVVAGRLSYLLDLRGPSLLLDTACSSSMVALHLAARSLRQGESDLALVGGVSAILHPDTYRQACRMRMLARDGRCKTFDASADGFLLGEGCGVVVLERLSDARARGHRVLAVVRGSAVNQDGTSNGLTAPNGAAQTAVIRQALADAGLTPGRVDFVEAHGSGTLLGDSIEMSSLQEVFGPGRPEDRPLVVGAVKTNVGHLVGAAGMAGLIKSVLALNHGEIPPNLHHAEPNPTIDWTRCPTLLPDRPTPWPEGAGPRVAGVSSFGWSGTNSHVVLERYEEPRRAPEEPAWQVLPLSARTRAAVGARAEELAALLARTPDVRLDDVAATLREGRSALDHRSAIVAPTVEAAATALREKGRGQAAHPVDAGHPARVALLLPGTGELRPGTGRELYERHEAFRAAFDTCAEAAHALLGLDLRDVLYSEAPELPTEIGMFRPGAQQVDADSPLYDRLEVGHAALFAVDYACARLWEHHGVVPDSLIGYSLGEYVAACLAGVFSLEDALLLVVRRAQLVAEAPPGAMCTVAAAPERLASFLVDGAVVAAANGPLTSVVAGPVEAVERVERRLGEGRIACMRVPTTRAMHSPMLAPQAARLEELVASVPRHAPTVPYVSNVTGTWITDEEACDPAYWSGHLCGTVRFAEGVERLAEGGANVLVEAGPGQLASFATQILTAQAGAGGPASGITALPTLPGAADRRPCGELFATGLARLWTLGAPVSLAPDAAGARTVTLPGYPFEHQHLWPPLVEHQGPGTGSGEPAGRADRAGSARSGGRARATGPEGPRVYVPGWEESPATEGGVLTGPFLVYADSTGIGTRLAETLAGAAPSVLVTPGDGFARTGPRSFTVRPGVRADQERLFAELDTPLRPRTVVHLWSVTGAARAPGLEELQALGFRSLIDCATSLSPLAPDGVRLLVVTDGARSVHAADTVEPGKATLTGPCLAIPQEYPGWSCHTVDIDMPASPDGGGEPDRGDEELTSLVEQLTDELRWPAGAAEVTLRSGTRRARTYRAAPPVPRGGDGGRAAPREGGVYLLTGGLGRIGLALAGHLATRARGVRIVLTGRTGLPPRETWDELLRTAPGSGEAARIRGVLELEERGADVVVRAVDTADAEALRGLVDDVRRRFGALHGVIHAAGLTSADVFAPMGTLTPAQVEAHFTAKVHGTLALREALAGEPLDFCLLMSSVSSVLGGLGFVAYAAANAFLDAFVEQEDAGRPGCWQSVNWDTWRSTVEGPGASGLGASLARYSFAPDDALNVLDGILGGPARLAVVQGDLDERMRAWVGGADPFGHPSQPSGDARDAPAPDPFARIGAGTAPVSDGDVERRLTALWQEALGHTEVGESENFFDLGGNSLIGMQLMNSVSKAFRLALPAVALFEAPTVRAMAAYVRERLGPESPQSHRTQPAPAVEARPGGADPLQGFAATGPGPVAATVRAARAEVPRASGHEHGHSADPLDDAVAVIGMAGRFPGAPDLDRFWKVLRDGVETISFFTQEELAEAGVPVELTARPDYVCARPVLDGVEMFDAEFFGYNPREARLLDPQQRLFLECCWEALENAGHGDASRPRPVGVFGGANISTYIRKLFEDPETAASVNDYQVVISNDKDALTTNVSYRLNLNGPSLGVQTFCSTSLVATHLAARSLLAGECDMALAGGVSVRVPDRVGHVYQEGGMESPDGHVRTFDAGARGSIFGDGAAVVLLKKLSRALTDGDPIAAVIRGSAVNNDGSLKAGFTAPSVRGQSEVITQALTSARVDPGEVSYVEAHGTATELGDPIEMAALTRAFRGAPTGSVRVGSVKTNLGHLDRAAGGTGLIKTVLSLQHGHLPPSLHFTTPNPEIDFENGPFRVNTALTRWKSEGKPLRAGVNSLGMGGTNVHVVLEEAPPRPPANPGRGRDHQLLVVSARDETALDAACARLARHLRRHPHLPLADVAFTLQTGRQRFDRRRAFVCRGTADAVRLLESGGADGRREETQQKAYEGREKRGERPVGFLFPGVGTGIGGADLEPAAGLYLSEEPFRRTVDHCCDLLDPALGDEVAELVRGTEDESAVRSELAEAAAAFVSEYALATLLASWGLRPDSVAGEGVGRYVAACVAGVMPLRDALCLVVERARSAGESAAGTREAGNTASLAEWISAHVVLSAPDIPCACPGADGFLDARRATDPQYWAAASDGAERPGLAAAPLLAEPDRLLLEVGAGDAMSTAVRAHDGCPADRAGSVLAALPGAPDRHGATGAVHATLAHAWVLGVRVDWTAYHADVRPNRVALPTYPFQRDRYWIDTAGRTTTAAGASAAAALPAADARPGARLAALPKLPTERWLYAPGWRQLAPRAPGHDLSSGTWLVLADGSGVGQAFATEVARAGGAAVLASPAKEFTRHGAGSFSLDPKDPAQWGDLLRALRQEGAGATHVVHMGGIDPVPADVYGTARADQGFTGPLALLQAIGAEAEERPATLTLVTSGAFAVTGDESVDPAKATAVGPAKVAPLEYPGLAVRLVDVPDPRSAADAVELARLVVRELSAGDGEPLVAVRGRRRWAPEYNPLAPLAEPAPESVLREGGVYLITGGLGGIGLAMAERLASAVSARLVLTGRSGLPERDSWEALVADPESPPELVRRIESVRALERKGAEVSVVPMDVADPDDVDRTIGDVLESCGRLDGVIHAAGLPGLGIMQFKTAEAAAEVLRPKLAGAATLRERLAGVPVDFLALFSSTASVTGGGPGQADYCAANAALDAEAEADPGSGPRVVTVNWGEWQWNAWEMGLAGFDESTTAFLRENRERIGISFDEGWSAFLTVLASGEPRLVVCSQDVEELADITGRLDLVELAGRASGEDGVRHPRPALPVPFLAPEPGTEHEVAQVWARVLGLEEVGVHDDFFDLGGNSLLGLDLVHRMRRALGCAWLPPHVLYQARTVRDLARLIDDGTAGGTAQGTATTGSGTEVRASRTGRAVNPEAWKGASQ